MDINQEKVIQNFTSEPVMLNGLPLQQNMIKMLVPDLVCQLLNFLI